MHEPSHDPHPSQTGTKKLHTRYFSVAVWVPVILLWVGVISAAIQTEFSDHFTADTFILRNVLATGPVSALLFALWATRAIRTKTRPEVIRLAIWAPIIFIPFYGIPWFAYGFGYLMAGHIHGLGMMAFWLAYAPYPVMFAYLYLGVVLVVYVILDALLGPFLRAYLRVVTPCKASAE